MRMVCKHQVKLIIMIQIIIRTIGTVRIRYNEERINKGTIDYCSKILMSTLERTRRIKEIISVITLMVKMMRRRVYLSKTERVSVGSCFLSMNRIIRCRIISMKMIINSCCRNRRINCMRCKNSLK